MQYRLKHKLHEKDLHSDINQLKNELGQSLKDEQHRQNVDHAKKTACKQLMDYANFEQMVLGADLKSVKTTELNSLVEMGREKRMDKVFNTIGYEETSLKVKTSKQEPKIDLERLAMIGRKSALLSETDGRSVATDISEFGEDEGYPIAKDFREFKKYYDLIWSQIGLQGKFEHGEDVAHVALMNWLAKQPKENYKKIFSSDFLIEYLVRLVDFLLVWVIDDAIYVSQRPIFSKFLDMIMNLVSMRGFDFGIKAMMNNSEKILIRKLLKHIGERNEDMFAEVVQDLLIKFK